MLMSGSSGVSEGGRGPNVGLERMPRSHHGSDEPWNLTRLCPWHHQRGDHAGWIRTTGSAPDDLVFELPVGHFRSGDRLDKPAARD
jgi:hypothetical protein